MSNVRALRDSNPDDERGAPAIPSDAALVEAARSGHSWAQEAIFHRYSGMALGLAHRLLLGTGMEPDDVVQDAFIAAYSRLDGLRSPEALGSWLGSIVIRQCSKQMRRHRLRMRLGLARRFEVDLDAHIAPEAPPEVHIELHRLYGRLARLPVEERVALVLRRVEGLHVAELAERMGLSLSTAKRRLRRAEERLERASLTSPLPRGTAPGFDGPTPHLSLDPEDAS